MRIEFYKQKWFGFSLSGGLMYQKCCRPSRDHEKQFTIGINIGKWKIGMIIYWKKLTEEQMEENQRCFIR